MKKRKWRYIEIEEMLELLNNHKITDISKSQTQPRDLNEYHDILSLKLDNNVIIDIPLYSSDLCIGELKE